MVKTDDEDIRPTRRYYIYRNLKSVIAEEFLHFSKGYGIDFFHECTAFTDSSYRVKLFEIKAETNVFHLRSDT